MNNVNKGWVALPQFLLLKSTPLKYQDALIYITIRSFLNLKTKACFPSYETLAEKAGVSRTFMSNSLKRLKSSGLITSHTKKVGTNKNSSNQYTFSSFVHFEQIPVSIFDCDDLSYTEKAMLICLRQLFIHGPLTCTYNLNSMAESIGITSRMVSAQLAGLLEKGYVTKTVIRLKNGKKINSKFVLTNKLPWNDYIVKPEIKGIPYRLLIC